MVLWAFRYTFSIFGHCQWLSALFCVHSVPNPTAEQTEFRLIGWAVSVAASLTVSTHEFKCVCSIIIPMLFLSWKSHAEPPVSMDTDGRGWIFFSHADRWMFIEVSECFDYVRMFSLGHNTNSVHIHLSCALLFWQVSFAFNSAF